jgi:hypothetical protein
MKAGYRLVWMGREMRPVVDPAEAGAPACAPAEPDSARAVVTRIAGISALIAPIHNAPENRILFLRQVDPAALLIVNCGFGMMTIAFHRLT